MLTGYKWFSDGCYCIKVEGFKTIRYIWYSRREAEKGYRERFGLKGKRINWIEG